MTLGGVACVAGGALVRSAVARWRRSSLPQRLVRVARAWLLEAPLWAMGRWLCGRAPPCRDGRPQFSALTAANAPLQWWAASLHLRQRHQLHALDGDDHAVRHCACASGRWPRCCWLVVQTGDRLVVPRATVVETLVDQQRASEHRAGSSTRAHRPPSARQTGLGRSHAGCRHCATRAPGRLAAALGEPRVIFSSSVGVGLARRRAGCHRSPPPRSGVQRNSRHAMYRVVMRRRPEPAAKYHARLHQLEIQRLADRRGRQAANQRGLRTPACRRPLHLLRTRHSVPLRRSRSPSVSAARQRGFGVGDPVHRRPFRCPVNSPGTAAHGVRHERRVKASGIFQPQAARLSRVVTRHYDAAAGAHRAEELLVFRFARTWCCSGPLAPRRAGGAQRRLDTSTLTRSPPLVAAGWVERGAEVRNAARSRSVVAHRAGRAKRCRAQRAEAGAQLAPQRAPGRPGAWWRCTAA